MASVTTAQSPEEVILKMSQDTQFRQVFANVMLYDELKLHDIKIPDTVFSKIPTWNKNPCQSDPNSNQLVFQINSPKPWLLTSMYITFSLMFDNVKFDDANISNYMPIADFFAQLLRCVNVLVGQNLCNIDHLDTWAGLWSYMYKRLFTNDDYANYMGRIDGMIGDTPRQYQLDPTTGSKNLVGANTRLRTLFQNGKCVRGSVQLPNFIFQLEKVWPPRVPMELRIQRTSEAAHIIKTILPDKPTFTITQADVHYMTYNLQDGIFENLRALWDKNRTSFPPLEIPQNPYIDPSATYQYFDVRLQKIPVLAAATTFCQTLRMQSTVPKAIVLALETFNENDLKQNQFEFSVDNIKSYQIKLNSENVFDCSIDSKPNCNNSAQDYYLRVRNFLGNGFSNDVNGLSYINFAGGAGILCELLNNSNNLFIPSPQEVGTLEVKVDFIDALTQSVNLIVGLIFDQTLLIDRQFNARLLTSV